MPASSNPAAPQLAPLTQVAVGIVHNDRAQVLFAQRPAGKPYAGWWEFPGGKFEAGESVAQALARELKEELGITILDCHAWLSQQFVYPHAHVNLQFCHVRHFSGAVQSLEGQAFAWGSVAAPPLPFLPAALPVLKVLQLPQTLHHSVFANLPLDHWRAALERLAGGVLILVEPELNEADARRALDACLAWKARAPLLRKVLVGSRHPARWRGECDGVHFSEQDLLAASSRPSLDWVSSAVTSRAALDAAKALGCDFVTVGTAPQGTKAGKRGMPWAALGELLAGSELAAYCVGASGEHELPFAFAAGAAGIVLAAA